MKLWATSCLHLRPETLDSVLSRQAVDMVGAGDSDVLLLVGDIIEPVTGWSKSLQVLLDTVKLPYIWVRGNNDFCKSGNLYSRELTYVYGRKIYVHTGVNLPWTPWASAHTVATTDEIDKFYGEMASDCLGDDGFSNGHVQVIATHYPFISRFNDGSWYGGRFFDLLSQLPSLKHLVFGHVHPQTYVTRVGQDERVTLNFTDDIPKEIVVGDRTIQIHLVSDHRERMFHCIGELE